ncbi:MAG TPA: tetratricopeptide repeat protein [Burkholderiales bacterium]|nr:tetratricopeptide repeat protein [Burkholderiales bacterium]
MPALEPILRARRRLAAGAPAEALREAEEALRRAPRDPDALYVLGAAHHGCGDLAAAEKRLRQAIQADAGTALFHHALGNVLQDRGALAEAIACYRRALRLAPDFAEAHNDLGTACFAQGETGRAEQSYRRAAALRPRHAVAYANLGALYRKLGLPREARRALQKELLLRVFSAFRFFKAGRNDELLSSIRENLESGNPRLAARIAAHAVERSPGDARAWALLSDAQHSAGKREEAIAAAEKAAALRPRDAQAAERLGRLLAQAGRLDEAAVQIDKSLSQQPRSRGARRAAAELALARRDWARAERLAREGGLAFALGEALFKQGRVQEAEAAWREALAADARQLEAWIRLGDLLRLGGRLEESLACLERAVELDEESAAAQIALGMALREKGRTHAAVERFELALRLDPANAQAHQQLGEILRYENRIAEAERRFREGLKARPGEPRLLVDLGMALADQMRYDEAFACIGEALARDARWPLALAAKGILLDLTGRSSEAERLLGAALEAAPGDADLGYNLAICRLRHARFAEGWQGFELRRQKENFVGRYRRFPFPEWQGEPLEGNTILVYPEQGLGDEIMYASCIPDLEARARHVVLECNPKLGELLARSFPRSTVIARSRTMANDWVNHLEPAPGLQAPIGSLPLRFRTRAQDFPAHRGFLAADPAKVAKWRSRLDALGPGRRIGLSWQGGVGHTGRARRSFTLEALLPVLRLPGVHFVSLQYTPEAKSEAEALRARHGVALHHWQEAIDDYDETAGLVCALDSVLTVCTAIVHLTGALGRPALVMVPFGSDWRYGASGDRMPWYPSVRLVRQSRIGDWSDVLATVRASLS